MQEIADTETETHPVTAVDIAMADARTQSLGNSAPSQPLVESRNGTETCRGIGEFIKFP